jgi:hypothetical protein
VITPAQLMPNACEEMKGHNMASRGCNDVRVASLGAANGSVLDLHKNIY